MNTLSKNLTKWLAAFMAGLVILPTAIQPASASSRTDRVIELINQMDEDELAELQAAFDDDDSSSGTYADDDDDDDYQPTYNRRRSPQRSSRRVHGTGYNAPVSYIGEPAIVLESMNRDREKLGLEPLTADAALTNAAKERAQEIRTLFEHKRPDGRDALSVLKDYGISYHYAGENIAYGDGMKGKQAYRAWYNSQGHYENMMNEHFTHIGIGYYKDSRGRGYWVQLFGSPQN